MCLKFPGNGAVRTDYDYSGMPFLWFVAQGGASLTLGKQRNEQKYIILENITLFKIVSTYFVTYLVAGKIN